VNVFDRQIAIDAIWFSPYSPAEGDDCFAVNVCLKSESEQFCGDEKTEDQLSLSNSGCSMDPANIIIFLSVSFSPIRSGSAAIHDNYGIDWAAFRGNTRKQFTRLVNKALILVRRMLSVSWKVDVCNNWDCEFNDKSKGRRRTLAEEQQLEEKFGFQSFRQLTI